MDNTHTMPRHFKRRYISAALALIYAGAAQLTLAETVTEPDEADASPVALMAEVVVSATRTEQDIFDIANTVTTISDDRIEKEMVTDIEDMLRYETGVSVRAQPNRSSGVFRATGRAGNEGINIRGLEGDQVLLQVDGVRLPATYASGPYAAGRGDYIDMEAYKRVEILRGPSSTQYGSDGLAGAVSFLTKDPTDLLTLGNPSQASVKLAYSSADSSWTSVPSFAYANDTLETMVLASIRKGHETKNMGTINALNVTRTTPNPQDTKSEYVLAKLVLKPNSNHKFKITVENLDRDIDTDVYSFFMDPFAAATLTNVDVSEDITRQQFKLDYDYTDSANQWFQRAAASIYKQDSKNRQWGLEERSTAPVVRWRNTLYGEDMVGGSLQLESNFGEAINHHLVYGSDASMTDVTSMKDGFNSSGTAFVPNKSFPDTDYRLFGAFVQDEISIGDFSVVPGIRYDSFKLTPMPDALYLVNNTTVPSALTGKELSPKFGVIWKLDPMANIFAQYAHGFRAPKPSQVNGGVTNLTAADPYRSIGNPSLRPETSNSIELGIRGRNHAVRYSASVFKGKYKDFISSNVLVESNAAPTPDVFQSVNLSNVEISGFELRGEWALHRDWSISASYAHASGDSTNAGTTTPLSTIDPDKLVLGLRYDKNDQYGGQLMVTAVERKNRNPNPSLYYTPGGYQVFDLTGYYNFSKNVSLNAGIFNIFDRKYTVWADVRDQAPNYAQIDSYSQPGRNVSLNVKYQF